MTTESLSNAALPSPSIININPFPRSNPYFMIGGFFDYAGAYLLERCAVNMPFESVKDGKNTKEAGTPDIIIMINHKAFGNRIIVELQLPGSDSIKSKYLGTRVGIGTTEYIVDGTTGLVFAVNTDVSKIIGGESQFIP
jgi:hypothetical protein